MLSTGHVLEAGICSVKWSRDLCHKNKENLISNVRININVAHVDSLSKQKVSPTLALFDMNLTTGLKYEHEKVAKGTWSFLEILQ